ncbi:hypothetical protein ACJRO7_035245 [Eucalyptus globulus]|uniref:Uncharacterized protein n=1 Tax=Eucalyptus globulus TaxID=34317 RepID=A0ABD3J8C0_EUCGL
MISLQRAAKSIHTAVAAPRLSKFSLHAPKCVEVEFTNGSTFRLSAEFLRICSPAADGKMRSIGGEKVDIQNICINLLCIQQCNNLLSFTKREEYMHAFS